MPTPPGWSTGQELTFALDFFLRLFLPLLLVSPASSLPGPTTLPFVLAISSSLVLQEVISQSAEGSTG